MANEIDAPHAVIHVVSPNEFGVDEKDDGTGLPAWDDPIKVRIGSFLRPSGKFYIGAISMDVLRRQGGAITREEVGIIKLAVDEHQDGDGDPVPMIELFLTPRLGQSQDADMQRVVTISRKGITFHVPTNAGGASTSGRVTRFYTDGGKFCVNNQDDQDNIRQISYRIQPNAQFPNVNPNDESTWVAVGDKLLSDGQPL